jgi:hypothetical protein
MLGNALKTRPPRIHASWKAVLTDNIEFGQGDDRLTLWGKMIKDANIELN